MRERMTFCDESFESDLQGRGLRRRTALRRAGSLTLLVLASGVLTACPPSRPLVVTPPSASGVAQVGSELTAVEGTWSGNPTSTSLGWQRCAAGGTSCVDVAGAAGPYAVSADDVGSALRVKASATNAQGTSYAYSEATDPVIGTPVGVTNHAGTLTADETWSPTTVHVITANVTVPSGRTLTIASGAVVKYKSNTQVSVSVGGSAIVRGSRWQPVHLTSWWDDSAGGDTNGDGNATTPGDRDYAYAFSARGSLTIDGAQVRHGQYAVWITDAAFALRDSNLRAPVIGNWARSNVLVVIRGNAFQIPPLPEYKGALVLDRLSDVSQVPLSGDQRNRFVGEGVSRVLNIERLTVPAGTIWGIDGESRTVVVSGMQPYCFNSGISVYGQVSITAGVVVKTCNQTPVSVQDGGSLTVAGIPLLYPVVFTDVRDDSIAGDSNNDGPSTPSGSGTYEQGIWVRGSADVSGAVFRYGQLAIDAEDADLVARDNRFESRVDLVGFQMISTIERNTFAPPARLLLSKINDPTGVAFAGPDRNVFEGEGPNRVVFLDRVTVPVDNSWTLGPEGGAVFVRGLPPYGFNGVTVEGVLELLPGTVVKTLPGNGDDFVIRDTGRLLALGDSDAPIVFTAYADDTIEGDTNGDGTATLPPLSPNQTTIDLHGSAEIANAHFLFAGTSIDAIDAELAAVDSAFEGKVYAEKYDGSTETQLERNTFASRFGIPLTLEDLEDVTGVALAGVDANVFIGEGPALGVQVARGRIPAGSSWRVGLESGAVLVTHADYDIYSGIAVSGALRLDPGVIVKNKANGSIRVEAGASAEVSGVAGQPVVFTAFTDDTAGGDTNGDGAESLPEVGSGSIAVAAVAGAVLTIERAEFRYSSKAISSSNAAVVVRDSAFESTQSAISAAQTWLPSLCPGGFSVGPGYANPVVLEGNTFDGHSTPAVSPTEMAKIAQKLATGALTWPLGWVAGIRVADTNHITWEPKECKFDTWTNLPVVATPVIF